MALIKDGYWPDTYWASRYWQEDYWPEYGAVAPAAPAAAVAVPSGMRLRRRVRRGYRRERLLWMLQQYLEVKVKQHD